MSVHLSHAHEPSYHHDQVLSTPWHCDAVRSITFPVDTCVCPSASKTRLIWGPTRHPPGTCQSNPHCPHCRRSVKWRVVKLLRRTGHLEDTPVSLSWLQIVWSEILRSPGVYVTFVVAAIVRFRRWRTRLYRSWAAVVGTTWPWPVITTFSVVVSRQYRTDCLSGDAKCLATAWWVAPACDIPMALLRWADVNLGVIVLTTVSACGLFKSLLMWPCMSSHGGLACRVTELHDARPSDYLCE